VETRASFARVVRAWVSIFTIIIDFANNADIRYLVAALFRWAGISRGYAALNGVAEFGAIAVQAVIGTERVIRCENASLCKADVVGAIHLVVAVIIDEAIHARV
jgi:hypothetical protein